MPESLGKKERQKRRAERAAQRSGKSEKKKKGPLREWLDAVVFAIIFMVIMRTVFFDLFQIPTPSMEKSLLVGDYIVVSKLHYGMRTPMTIGIPFTQIYVRGLDLPWTRFPGFSEPKRFDAVVFNWPADDDDKPIDRKTYYIKRIIGIPGDTLEIIDKIVHVNGDTLFFKETKEPFKDTMQRFWYVYKEDPRMRLPSARLEELGVSEQWPTMNPTVVRIQATDAAAKAIEEWEYVTAVNPVVREPAVNRTYSLYPPSSNHSTDNYGPLTIPGKDLTVDLTPENWPVYEPVITKFEGLTASLSSDSTFRINGEVRDTYTFTQDYFFVMGDNRDNSEDSRFWGFVPMDHVVGRAVAVYFSWNSEGSPFILGQIRGKRMFRAIQ